MTQKSTALFWFRRDLRLEDNRGLAQATRVCERVYLIFVFDEEILGRLPSRVDRRVDFIIEALKGLREQARTCGGELLVRFGNPKAIIPQVAAELKVDAVFANEDYEPYAKARDQALSLRLRSQGCEFHLSKDQVVFNGGDILKSDGTPYRVFTPYKNAWLKRLTPMDLADEEPQLTKLRRPSQISSGEISYKILGFERSTVDFWVLPSHAQKSLQKFLGQISKYHTQRDFPALDQTSRLSVHLRFGTISIRKCVREALRFRNLGAQTWLSELIWREFYQMILDQFPHVATSEFLEKFQGIKWPGSVAHFNAWCEGRTGYPIVDAAIRQLNQTGWMHNRLRMVVASFLVKDLLVDWRKGERYFADKLLDFDLASNNGGWQWCASTGCDASPYFRIFNPTNQSKKFDPEGDFIRTYVPELASFDSKTIHAPHVQPKKWPKGFQIGRDYPPPIVDHGSQRAEVLKLYKF